MICNIQFPSLFTIIIILIYLPPLYNLWNFLADLSSILEYFTLVNTVILGDFNIQINNENHASLSLNKLIFDYSLRNMFSLLITLIVIILTFFIYS